MNSRLPKQREEEKFKPSRPEESAELPESFEPHTRPGVHGNAR